ncbi:MAG: FAD-dependent oxidoreductase, partial [Planctomycetota bacterium]
MSDVGPRYLLPFDTFGLPQHLTDVLVAGTGVAGYSAALASARLGQRVLVLSKEDPKESNTAYAQGGVAAVLRGGSDSPERHALDTFEVGQGLCDEGLVRRVTAAAAEAIDDLVSLGARFDSERDT